MIFRRAFVGAVLSVTLAPPALAQRLRGRVAEIDVAEPISLASVWLTTLAGEVQDVVFSDSGGTFDLRAPQAGWYRLRVHHPGYRSNATEVRLPVDTIVTVRVNLTPRSVIELDPIVVTAAGPSTPGQREFASRLNRKWGKQVTQKELVESAAGSLRAYLNFWASYARGRCQRLYLDGRRANSAYGGADAVAWLLDYPIDWIYGVEIYRTQDDAPIRYRERIGPGSRCGVVLVWSTTIDTARQ